VRHHIRQRQQIQQMVSVRLASHQIFQEDNSRSYMMGQFNNRFNRETAAESENEEESQG